MSFERCRLYVRLILLCGWCASLCTEAQPSKLMLVPMPQDLHVTGTVHLGSVVTVISSSDEEDIFSARELEGELHLHGVQQGLAKNGRFTIRLLRSDSAPARKILAQKHIEYSRAMKDEG